MSEQVRPQNRYAKWQTFSGFRFPEVPIRNLGLFILLLSWHICSANASRVCDVQSYGAKGNGVSSDTQAIQKAIDVCRSKGGGIVRLRKGIFLTGPIELKSHITLEIDKGATLLGSQNMADYPPAEELQQQSVTPLIRASHASFITIRGGGVINGNGQPWWKAVYAHDASKFTAAQRPRLILLDHCRHVLIQNITIENSASWQIVPYDSDDVVIRHSRILAPAHSPNTDGIDPFSSHHVTISHVMIDTGDDNIAIKSGQPDSQGPNSPSTYIRVRDCVFRHGHGLSVGSEVSGGVQHVYVSNLRFIGTRHGVRIKSGRDRGGDISDLVFHNLKMTDVGIVLVITGYYPKIPLHDTAKPMTRLTPRFHNITIVHLTATGAKSAGLIEGLPESPIRNLRLQDIHIQAQTGMTIRYATLTAQNLFIHAARGKTLTLLAGARLISDPQDADR